MIYRTVELRISAELDEEFRTVQHAISGYEVERHRDDDKGQIVILMSMPDAPPDAVSMTPWFTRHIDGSVTLQAIEYFDNAGQRVN